MCWSYPCCLQCSCIPCWNRTRSNGAWAATYPTNGWKTDTNRDVQCPFRPRLRNLAERCATQKMVVDRPKLVDGVSRWWSPTEPEFSVFGIETANQGNLGIKNEQKRLELVTRPRLEPKSCGFRWICDYYVTMVTRKCTGNVYKVVYMDYNIRIYI